MTGVSPFLEVSVGWFEENDIADVRPLSRKRCVWITKGTESKK